MASNSDILLKARQNAKATIAKAKVEYGITDPVPQDTSKGYTGFDVTSGTVQNRDVLDYVPEIRSGGGIAKDVTSALGGAATGVLKTGAYAVGLANAGYGQIGAALTGQVLPEDYNDQIVNNFTKYTGLDRAEKFFNDNESIQTKRKRAELAAITNNRNIGEGERFRQVSSYYLNNPTMLGLDTAKVIPQSIGEMMIGGKLIKGARVLNRLGSATKAGVNAGGSIGFNSVGGIAQDAEADLSPENLLAAFGNAAAGGVITGGMAKFTGNNFDIDRIGTGGNAAVTKQNPLLAIVKSYGYETLEETPQEVIDQITTNFTRDEILNYQVGSAAATGAAIGGLAGGVTAAPSALGTSFANLADAVDKKLVARGEKRAAISENQKDPNSEEFSPSTVYRQALRDMGSSDVKVRTAAQNDITKMSESVNSQLEAFDMLIESTTDQEEKAELLAEKAAFEKDKADPFRADIANYKNHVAANKDAMIDDVLKYMAELDEKYVDAIAKVNPSTSGVSKTNTNVPKGYREPGSATDTGTVTQGTSAPRGNMNTVDAITASLTGTESGGSTTAFRTNRDGRSFGGLLQFGDARLKEYSKATGAPQVTASTFKNLSAAEQKKVGDWHISDLMKEAQATGGIGKTINGVKVTLSGLVAVGHLGGTAGMKKFVSTNGSYNKQDQLGTSLTDYLRKHGGVEGGSGSRTTRTKYLGDGLVDNSSLAGLRIKGKQATNGGKVYGYTAEFAQITQQVFGNKLRNFASFNDNFHAGSTSKHASGRAFDFSLADGKNSKADSIAAEKMLYAEAAANGYSITVLNEYVKPSKNATGGHLHVTVNGRTNPTGATGNQTLVDNNGVPIPITEWEDSAVPEEDIEKSNLTEDEKNVIKERNSAIEQGKSIIRASFSTLSENEINGHPLMSQKQKDALKALLDVKKQMAEIKDVNGTHKDIMEGDQRSTTGDPLSRNLGVKQYNEVLTNAVATNDVSTVNKYLGFLGRFAQGHQDKSDLVQSLIAETSNTNRIPIAMNEDGKWIDARDYTAEQLKGMNTFEVRGQNRVTDLMLQEADTLTKLRDSWGVTTASMMTGVTPFVPSASVAPVTPAVTPVTTPAASTPPVTPTSSATPPPTAPVSAKYGAVANAEATPSNGFYLGRAKDADGEWVSMSAINPDKDGSKDGIGKPGWLGDQNNNKPIDAYLADFKKYAKMYDEFVPQLVKDLGKDLFGYAKPKPNSETNFLADLSEMIKGKSEAEVKDIVDRIEGYSKKNGIKLTAEMFDGDATNDNQYSNKTFGFDNTNKYGLNTTTDESLAANKKAIDEAIDKNMNSAFPSKGVGSNIQASAPKTYAYLNEQLKDRIGVDNAALVRNNPSDIRADGKARSSIKAGKKTGKASAPIAPTKTANEKSSKSATAKGEYTNQYIHTEDNGEVWQILINRNSETNNIEDVSFIQGEDAVETRTVPDVTFSDEAVIKWLQEGTEKLFGTYKQTNYNGESQAEPAIKTSFVNKAEVPTAVVNKAIKLTDFMTEFLDNIDPKNISAKNKALYVSIINTLNNYNPELRVNITGARKNSGYNEQSNLIVLGVPDSGHILQELARVVISTSIENTARKLSDNSYDKMDVDNKALIKLNQDIVSLKYAIDQDSHTNEKLTKALRIKILGAMSTNESLLSAATTDPELVEYLQGIQLDGETKKTKSSVFRKIVSSLRTFFKIGNNNEIATAFDSLIDITARTAQIEAINKEVSFNSSEEGKAKVFQNMMEANATAELDKNFYARNNLIAKFTQESKRSKPLSSIANLASKLKLDLMQGVNSLTRQSPSKAQREQLQDFLKFRDEFAVHLIDTFESKKIKRNDEGEVVTDYSYQDLKSHLMDEFGEIDENTITAAALAAYDWIGEYGNKTTNLDKDIRKLLNMEPDSTDFIPSNIKENYTDGVSIKNVQSSSMGRKVTQAMNIKANFKGSIEVASELDSSIGEWVVNSMQAADLIHLRTMKSIDHYINIFSVGGELNEEQMTLVREEIKSRRENKPSTNMSDITFMSVVDKDGKNRNTRLQEIVDASKGTLNYMQAVFGSEIGLVTPLMEVPTEVTRTIRNTPSMIDDSQAADMKTMQEAPMRVNDAAYEAMLTIMDKHRGATLLMFGAEVTDEQVAAEHVSDRHSLVSAAQGIFRELDNMMDFVGTLGKDSTGVREEFFDSIYGAKNNRMHYGSNMVNFQLSKVHRAMVEYDNFKSDIDISGLDTQNWFNEDGTTSQLGFFMRGLMENAEGTEDLIKDMVRAKDSAYTQGFTVDKLPSEVALDPFYEYLQTDQQVQEAVAAMDKLLNAPNTFGNADMEAVKGLVDFWGGGATSFRALTELSKLRTAQSNGDKSINTSLGLGSDGVNNGIAISTVQMGVATARFLAQVGIITNAAEFEGVRGYFDTRKMADLGDYYEGLKSILLNNLGKPDGAQGAMIKLNSSIEKRAFMKAILIPFGYSAGDKRLEQIAFSQFLEDIKGTMKKVAASDLSVKENLDTYNELKENLKLVTGEDIDLPTGKDLLEFWFTGKQLGAMKSLHEDGIAIAVKESIEEYASEFIVERNRNVKIQGAQSEAYLVAKKSIVAKGTEKYKQQLIAMDAYKNNTEQDIDKIIELEGIPADFYYAEIETELAKIRPTLKTPFNHASTDSTSDFSMTKGTKTLSGSKAGNSAGKRVTDENLHSTTTELSIAKMIEEAVGITVSSAQVQAVDAFIAAWTSARGGSVNRNIHDQGDSGMANYTTMGNTQNKATFEALKSYHVQTESLAAMGRMLDGLTEMLANDGITPEIYQEAIEEMMEKLMGKKAVAKAVEDAGLKKDASTTDVFAKVFLLELQNTIGLAKDAEHRKLETLMSMKVVQQYAGENGEYIVTEEDRDSVLAEYAVVDRKLAAVSSSVDNVLTALSNIVPVNIADEGDAIVTTEPNLKEASEVNARGWNRHSVPGTVGYEVSSASNKDGSRRGDRRFSALYALHPSGLTIEEAYQFDVKGYRAIAVKSGYKTGDRKIPGKGQKFLTKMTVEEGYQAYKQLWKDYLTEYPQLFDELVAIRESGSVFTDTFANTPNNQARVFAELVEEGLDTSEKIDDIQAYIKGMTDKAISDGDPINDMTMKMANYVLGAVKAVNPNLTFSISTRSEDSNMGGYYSPVINHIVINKAMMDVAAPSYVIGVIMHEIIHGITTNKMRHTSDPTVMQAFKELELMYVELRDKSPKWMSERGGVLENVYEMIAYGLTEGRHMKYIIDNLHGDYTVPTTPQGKAIRRKRNLKTFMDSIADFFMGSLKAKNAQEVANRKKGLENFDKLQRLVDITIQKMTDEEIINSQYINKPYRQYANAQQSPLDTLKNLSAGNVSTEHSEHLDGIINGTITGRFNRSTEDADAITDIVNNVSMRAITAGFALSDKELYTMEIVKAYTNEYLKENSGSKSAKELREVFRNVTAQITRDSFLSDPSTATASEKAIAQRKLLYVKGQDALNAKEQVERFAALAATSAEFRGIIENLSNERKSTREGNLFEQMMAILENIFRVMTGKYLGTANSNNALEVDTLLNRLDIINNNARKNTQNKLDIAYVKSLRVVTAPLNKVTDTLINGLFKAVDFSESKLPAVNSLATGLRAISKARVTGLDNIGEQAIMNNASRSSASNTSGRLNGWGEFLNELVRTKGMKATVEEMIRMTNKVGQLRDTVKKNTIKAVNAAFTNDGKDLTVEESNSLTQVLLRPDMSSLLSNGYQIAKVMKLIRDSAARKAEIVRLEGIIYGFSNGNDMLLQTKSLAMYMAKEQTSEHLVKNAENIAIGMGSWYETDMSRMNTDIRDAVDSLASLYAFEYTDSNHRNTLIDLMSREEEGVKAVLQAHKDIAKAAKDEFKDNAYSYIKGYAPQLTNERKSLVFAENRAEITRLENEGWVKVSTGQLHQDSSDKTDARTLMYHNDMLYQDYVSGALDMKDTHAKGTNIYTLNSIQDLQRTEQEKLRARRVRANNSSYLNYDPRIGAKSTLIAGYNSEGVVTRYSYEMSGDLRDTYLERNNNGLEMLGIMQSDAKFKPAIVESQQAVAQAMYEDFVKSYGTDPRQYVTLDPKSKDPKVQTMYRMMPYAFKQEATKLFGEGNPIVVRSNVYNAVFGFRAYSLTEMFDKITGEKNGLEKLITTIVTAIFKDKSKMRVLQAERAWQAGMTKIKDFIVIRNHEVLVGNVVANSLLLALHGVPPSQQAKDMISVWRNGGDYRKLASRIVAIDTELSINQSRPKEISRLKRERNIAMQELEQNPMHPFMEAGLMSTIVEDVSTLQEDTSFKSDFEKKVEQVEGYIPEQIRTAFEWAIMSPGTPLHEFMKHSTQFSDLAAKYSLANHQMKQGTSMKDAITVAQDNFINYDVPTGKGIDYMNRMGLFMFTKFFIRFQQVLMNMLNKKAGSTIAQHVGIEYFTDLSGVLDPLALSRLGNVPLEAGVFNYANAFGNISTVDAITGLVN